MTTRVLRSSARGRRSPKPEINPCNPDSDAFEEEIVGYSETEISDYKPEGIPTDKEESDGESDDKDNIRSLGKTRRSFINNYKSPNVMDRRRPSYPGPANAQSSEDDEVIDTIKKVQVRSLGENNSLAMRNHRESILLKFRAKHGLPPPKPASPQPATLNTEQHSEKEGVGNNTNKTYEKLRGEADRHAVRGYSETARLSLEGRKQLQHPRPATARSVTHYTEQKTNEEIGSDVVEGDHILSQETTVPHTVTDGQVWPYSLHRPARAQSASPSTEEPHGLTPDAPAPVPDEFLRFATLIKDPPPEGITCDGLLQRAWLKREFGSHFTNNFWFTLKESSPIYQLGRERLEIGEKLWDYLTKTDTSPVLCDEPVALSPQGHSQEVAKCQGKHGQQGGLDFHFCRNCYEYQLGLLSKKARYAYYEGWLTPLCEDCHERAWGSVCHCDTGLGVYCLRCQQAHLESMNDALETWPYHGPSRGHPDLSIRYCACGGMPVSFPTLFICINCRGLRMIPKDGHQEEKKVFEGKMVPEDAQASDEKNMSEDNDDSWSL